MLLLLGSMNNFRVTSVVGMVVGVIIVFSLFHSEFGCFTCDTIVVVHSSI